MGTVHGIMRDSIIVDVVVVVAFAEETHCVHLIYDRELFVSFICHVKKYMLVSNLISEILKLFVSSVCRMQHRQKQEVFCRSTKGSLVSEAHRQTVRRMDPAMVEQKRQPSR